MLALSSSSSHKHTHTQIQHQRKARWMNYNFRNWAREISSILLLSESRLIGLNYSGSVKRYINRSAESHHQPSSYWLGWRLSFRYSEQLSCYLMSIYNVIYNLTHCGGLAARLPHIRLLQPPLLSCRLLFRERCQVQEGRRTHTQARTVCSRWRHILKTWTHLLTLKADRSISSRLRAGESLAMMKLTE